jgi:hypothetical protein
MKFCFLAWFVSVVIILESPVKASPLHFDARITSITQVGELDIDSVDPIRGGVYNVAGSWMDVSPFSSLIWTRNSIPVSGVAGVLIETKVSDGGGTLLFGVVVKLPFQGMVSGDGTSHLSGIFNGAIGTSADLYDPFIPRDQYPQPILDLLTHPDRVHLTGYVTGGRDNVLGYQLTIDPSPVPEPTVLALLVMGIGGLGFGRLRSLRTRRLS